MNRRIASRMSAISPSLTLAITAKAKAHESGGGAGRFLRRGANPDFNTPKNIIDAAKAALDKGYTKYTPSSGLLPLRKAICEKFKKDNGLDYDPSANHRFRRRQTLHFQRLFRAHRRGGRGDYPRSLLAHLSGGRQGLRRRTRVSRMQERGQIQVYARPACRGDHA